MRTGIISDVHGNLPALEMALTALRARGVDRIVCLGDVVGYGAQPEQCVEIVREVTDFCLLGNHDAVACDRMRFQFARDEGRRMVEYVKGSLSSRSIDWLKELPLTVKEGDVRWSHGDPVDPGQFRYILSLDQAVSLVPHYRSLLPLSFIGHSHFERSFRLWPRGASEIRGDTVKVGRPWRFIVNVGSVGQPRDRDPRSATAIWDDDTRTIEFVRTSYDIRKAADAILAAGLPAFFARRLFAGW